MFGTQAAVASNTQALVQSNIAARAVRMSRQPTPAPVWFSPCGQLLAWTEGLTLKVRDRRARRQVLSHPVPSLAVNGTISFSSNSSWLTLIGADSAFVADIHSGVMTKLDIPGYRGIEECSWAPSACSMAIIRSPGFSDPSSLFLYQGLGSELRMVHRLQQPLIRRLVWAANSRVLAMMSDQGVCMLDTVSLDLVHLALPGNVSTGAIAWSPSSWDTPHLLCMADNGKAVFANQKAEMKGRGGDPMQDAHAPAHLVWSEHGVVVLTRSSLWLSGVASTPIGLVLVPRHHVMVPLLTTPVLSPDQVHVCMLQETRDRGIESHYDLIILNIESHSQAVISLPEPLLGAPTCSWTSRGYSLAVTLAADKHRSHLYKMFRFVF